MRYEPHVHKVQYYETDQMGITHHSNYVRWYEEARCELLEKIGIKDGQIEKYGVMFPMLSLEVNYMRMTYFRDIVLIDAYVKEYDGRDVVLGYDVIIQKSGKLCSQGSTKHCFTNEQGRRISLQEESPALHEIFLKAMD